VAVGIVALAVFGRCPKRGVISTPLIAEASLEAKELGCTSKVEETAKQVDVSVDGECAGGSDVSPPAVSASCPAVADVLFSYHAEPVKEPESQAVPEAPREVRNTSVVASPPVGDAGDVPYEDDEMHV